MAKGKEKMSDQGAEYENSTQLEKVYNVASRTSVSVIVEGEHGIGKSESVYSFCAANDIHVEPLFLSHQEVADLIGIPTMERDITNHALTTWSKPIWLHRLEEAAKAGKRTCLFLDELNRAQSEVRQAALQLVLDKQIHEHKLPTVTIDDHTFQTFVVAAVNPADDGFYQVDELDPALVDRFLHFTLKVNVPSWLEWAGKNNVHKAIVSFISKSPDKLNLRDENAKLYPTPRSWVKLSELLKAFEDLGFSDDSTLSNVINGKIGPTVGSQFMSYYKENSVIITVEDVEAVVNKYWVAPATTGLDTKEAGKVTAQAVDNVAVEVKKLIEKLEIPLLKELTQNMKTKYLPTKDSTTFDEAMPLVVLLHSLPIEQLAAFIKEVQVEQEDKQSDRYNILSSIAPGKEIFHRIVQRTKKLSIGG